MTRAQVRRPDWDHCLEGDVSGRAMLSAAQRFVGERATAADLLQAAVEDGDAAAWLACVQEELAMAVADVAALLDPDAIIFGGGVIAAQGEPFLSRIRELARRCFPGRHEDRVVTARRGRAARRSRAPCARSPGGAVMRSDFERSVRSTLAVLVVAAAILSACSLGAGSTQKSTARPLADGESLGGGTNTHGWHGDW